MEIGKFSVLPPRTLVLVHPRRQAKVPLELARRMWVLNDPAFNGQPVFYQRVSLVEEGSDLPDQVEMSAADLKVFSHSGALDDATPPYRSYITGEIAIPASEDGCASPGNQTFILGGGNLDFCLESAFRSLIRLKSAQREPCAVAIPLALIYQEPGAENMFDYIRHDNKYTQGLWQSAETGGIVSYSVYEDDGQPIVTTGNWQSAEAVSLHWYTSLQALFRSRFFPETSRDPAALDRLKRYFCYNPR
jgi:hypothetical protein